MLIRGASANPSSLKYAALMNKQSIAENEVFKPDTSQPSIISTHTEDTILLQDPFFFRKLQFKNQKFYAPWEPDGVLLKYWCKFNHIARQMRDHSFSGNYTYPHGSPKLCEGPDDGTKGGRIISKINSNINIVDYYSTPDNTNIRTSTASNGFSIYLEFIAEQTESPDGGLDTTLQYKYDDSNNSRVIAIRPAGELAFFVRKGGSDFSFCTPANAITPNTLYKCWFAYHPTGNIQVMRINNVPPSDASSPGFTLPTGTTEMIHGKRGSSNNGRFKGKLIDSRMYNFFVENAMMDAIWNNGRSICAAPAINLDGVNNNIDLGVDTTNWSKTLTKFSCSIWFRPDTVYDVDYRNLLTLGDSNDEFFIVYVKDAQGPGLNALQVGVTKDGYTTSGDVFITTTTSQKYNNVIVTFDSSGSNNLKAYHDGALIGSANYAFSLPIASSTKMFIGRYFNDPLGTFHFDGRVRDLRWWNNTTLTEPQVIAVRDNLSTAPTPNYWLKMSEGNGNPTDWITRTKVGTLSNGASWTLSSSHRPTELGSLAVAGYTRFNEVVDTSGFDAVGYDSTGFDAT